MTTSLERDLRDLLERQGPASPYEPVAVDPRYPPPPRTVDPDHDKGWLRRIWPLVAARRRTLAVALSCAFVAVAAQVAAPRVIMAAIDGALVGRDHPLAPFVWTLAALAVARGLATWAQRAFLFRFAFDLEADLRVLLYAHLGRQPFRFFDRVDSGELISRANSDVRAIQLFLSFTPLMAIHLSGLALALVLMLSVHVPLTLVAVAPLLGVLAAGAAMRARLYPLSWIVQARQAAVAGVVAENVSGVRVVRSFAAEQQQITTLSHAARRLRWASVRQLDVRATFGSLIEALPRTAVVLVLGYGGWLAMRGAVTVGAIVAFSAYVGLLQPPFRMLGSVLMMGQRAAASARRVYELLDHEPEVRDAPGAIDLHADRGEVRLDGVRFGYEAGSQVLDGVDLVVQPGETVALVGRTGSGKSTVARLVARYYDVDQGAVYVDGHDVRDLTLASLRAAVGTVFDEPFLFAGTVRDNIAYARPDASDEEVRAAAATAQAGFVESLPEGYETTVGERGYTLSGGQRQRVALARALLADPAVLVLDDATSAVDAEVERAVYEALRARAGSRTTLVVSHRRSTIARCDRVVLLDGGRVVASGPPAALAADHRYAEVLGDPSGSRT